MKKAIVVVYELEGRTTSDGKVVRTPGRMNSISMALGLYALVGEVFRRGGQIGPTTCLKDILNFPLWRGAQNQRP